METYDLLKTAGIVLGIIGVLIAFVIMPIMDRRKIDTPVWLILLLFLIAIIEFIIGGRIFWITLH